MFSQVTVRGFITRNFHFTYISSTPPTAAKQRWELGKNAYSLYSQGAMCVERGLLGALLDSAALQSRVGTRIQ